MKYNLFHLVAILLLWLPRQVDASWLNDLFCGIPFLNLVLCNECTLNDEPCGGYGDCVGKLQLKAQYASGTCTDTHFEEDIS